MPSCAQELAISDRCALHVALGPAVHGATVVPDQVVDTPPMRVDELALGRLQSGARASDPVGAGLVDSLARPGGNATGFLMLEYDLSGKWLELLKQIAPNVTRVAIIRDPGRAGGIGEFGALASAAQSFRTELTPVNPQDPAGIERAISAFAHAPNGGLIVTTSGLAIDYCDLIVALAARYKLPAVYFERSFVTAGGLVSYGPGFVEQYRRAAAYVDRILKGEKPADLPVQAPTKYELVINLQTAKTLGLTVPNNLLSTADEVIE